MSKVLSLWKIAHDMNYKVSDTIEYIVALVSEFAKRFSLTDVEAYRYMRNHKAIPFVTENYGALHTLDFGEVLDCIAQTCRKNGGVL